jgi:hypothetical protein
MHHFCNTRHQFARSNEAREARIYWTESVGIVTFRFDSCWRYQALTFCRSASAGLKASQFLALRGIFSKKLQVMLDEVGPMHC